MPLTKRYFKHDVDASEDEKLVDILINFGNEGYGLYWRLVEILYKSGGQIDYKLKNISFRLNCEPELFNTFISSAIDLSLFQLVDKKLFCARVKNEVEKLDNLIEKRKSAGSKGGNKKKENQGVSSKCLASAKNNCSKPVARLSNLILSNTLKSTKIGNSTKRNTTEEVQELTPTVQVLSKELRKVEPKIQFGEFENVELTEPEIKKLEIAYKGRKDVFEKAVFLLGSWKLDNPTLAAKRKSDYRQLLNWPLEKAFREVTSINKNSNPISNLPFVPSAAERAQITTELNFQKFKSGNSSFADLFGDNTNTKRLRGVES